VLGHGAVQCVLDWKHSALRAPVKKSREYIGRDRARKYLIVASEIESSHMAVGAALSLDGHTSGRRCSGRGSCLITMCRLVAQKLVP